MNYLTFKAYTIKKIEEPYLYVDFEYQTDEGDVNVPKKFDYTAKTGYDAVELQNVDEEYRDKDGKVQVRTVKKPVMVLHQKHLFDIEDSVALDHSLRDWAYSYLAGKVQEEQNRPRVTEDVGRLIGVKNTLKGS